MDTLSVADNSRRGTLFKGGWCLLCVRPVVVMRHLRGQKSMTIKGSEVFALRYRLKRGYNIGIDLGGGGRR